MYYITLTLGTILLSMTCKSDANKICYRAKICIHTGIEKCGVDSKGNLRRFLDSCDLREYNCIYKTDYAKVPNDRCECLPPITEEEKEKKQEEDKKEHVDTQDEVIKETLRRKNNTIIKT